VYYRESVWKDGAPEKQSAPLLLMGPCGVAHLVPPALSHGRQSKTVEQAGDHFEQGTTCLTILRHLREHDTSPLSERCVVPWHIACICCSYTELSGSSQTCLG
jgi:hypothetical protein